MKTQPFSRTLMFKVGCGRMICTICAFCSNRRFLLSVLELKTQFYNEKVQIKLLQEPAMIYSCSLYPDRKTLPDFIPTAPSPGLPWPVIIGIPAGVAFILCTALLWFCRSKRSCSSSSSSSSALPAAQRLPVPSRDRACPALPPPSANGDKDCHSYEDYITHQQLLLAQGGTGLATKVYPKIYTDIHTHTHSHVDGKVHQHQHIHYQC